MGGHGTYILIQIAPDYFAAAAPSAGSGLRRTEEFIDASLIDFGALRRAVPKIPSRLLLIGLPLTMLFGTGLGVGVVGFGLVHPAQSGLAGRLDVHDVGALKAGYGWGLDDGWLIAIELALGFLRDLGR